MDRIAVRIASTITIAGWVLLMGVSLLWVRPSMAAEPVTWHMGDVFVAVGNGAYQVYDRNSGLK